MKLRSFLASASARLSLKAPSAANLLSDGKALPIHVHEFFPTVRSGPLVRCLGQTLTAEDLLRDIEVAVLVELRGTEDWIHLVRISEDHFIVIVDVPAIRNNLAAGSSHSLHGMRAHDPVTNIDHMNILLQQNVARERFVPEPVTQALLVCRHATAICVRCRGVLL